MSEPTVSERAVSEPVARAASMRPTPTDEEAVAIVAAMEVLWPKPVIEMATATSRDRSWKFSGRWWARPVAVRRDRPWR
ncbi:MAG: hypothetical protein ABWZ99_13550 [Ilumatobacteraceae bacterium]